MKFIIPIFIIVLYLSTTSVAQTLSRSVIGATGSVNPLLSSTVGQVGINTGTYGGGILTQGFQQPDLAGNFGSMLCNLPANHTILADTLSSGSYRAPGDVEFVGGALQNGTFVSISAASSIRFSAGFSAAAGSDLYAYIASCNTPALIAEQAPPLPDITVARTGSVSLRCYPNPFRDRMTIDYELPETTRIFLAVTDLNGRTLVVLEDGVEQASGRYRRVFDTRGLQAGIYFLSLRTANERITRKLVALR